MASHTSRLHSRACQLCISGSCKAAGLRAAGSRECLELGACDSGALDAVLHTRVWCTRREGCQLDLQVMCCCRLLALHPQDCLVPGQAMAVACDMWATLAAIHHAQFTCASWLFLSTCAQRLAGTKFSLQARSAPSRLSGHAREPWQDSSGIQTSPWELPGLYGLTHTCMIRHWHARVWWTRWRRLPA